MWNSTFCSWLLCLFPLQEEDPDSDSEKLLVKETEDDEESVQDMIEIHFQKPSNGGGETENIKYVSKGATWVCFEEDG